MTTIREIAFDTETTGLNWEQDDRIIELGAVELINHVPTGVTFQTYVNPGRSVSEATIQITGITDHDLVDKPFFAAPEVVDALVAFFGDATIVAHNAAFDRGFLNMELQRCGREPIPDDRWIDTAALARRRYPGAPASLDALCKRFDINAEARTFHGALLDSQLLAEVYLELLGGRARAFDFGDGAGPAEAERERAMKRPGPRPVLLSERELSAHAELIEEFRENAIWSRYS